jgi:spermidine dehydrogenase
MHRSITRRDFLNGCALTVGASLTAGSPAWLEMMASADTVPEKDPSYYPPAKTGMRGSHDGSWEVAHGMRDGQT